MKTITATFTGTPAILFHLHMVGNSPNTVMKLKSNNTLIIHWITEETNYKKALESCKDSVSMSDLELWGCELQSIE